MNLSRLILFVSEMVPLMIRQGSGKCWAFRHVATQVVSPLEAIVPYLVYSGLASCLSHQEHTDKQYYSSQT